MLHVLPKLILKGWSSAGIFVPPGRQLFSGIVGESSFYLLGHKIRINFGPWWLDSGKPICGVLFTAWNERVHSSTSFMAQTGFHFSSFKMGNIQQVMADQDFMSIGARLTKFNKFKHPGPALRNTQRFAKFWECCVLTTEHVLAT